MKFATADVVRVNERVKLTSLVGQRHAFYRLDYYTEITGERSQLGDEALLIVFALSCGVRLSGIGPLRQL